MTTEKKKEQFIQAFELAACNISVTCRKIGISRQCFYKWCNEDPEFKVAIDDLQEATIDMAETSLFKHIKEENLTALIFFLKTKGKHRGYVERTEVTNKAVSEFEGKTDEELEAELIRLRAKQEEHDNRAKKGTGNSGRAGKAEGKK